MIAKHYIDRAVKIRKEFLSLNVKLTDYLDKIKLVRDNIEVLTEELKQVNKDIKSDKYRSEEEARKVIFGKIAQIEKEAKVIEDIYKPVNERMEDLAKEEEILYNNIKEKYPELSDNEIVDEIKKYITE